MRNFKRFDAIAFDADDTLWHEIGKYHSAESELVEMLAHYNDEAFIRERFAEIDVRNLKVFGYGIKGFTLSLIETAIELTEGRVTGTEIGRIIAIAKEMLRSPVDIFPHVEEVLKRLRGQYQLMLVTKGDLFDQESKIARSGLADYFEQIEILSDKQSDNYRAMLRRYSIVPERFVMVGNSLRSDILPICQIGGYAVHIPYDATWSHEHADLGDHHYTVLHSIAELPEQLERWHN